MESLTAAPRWRAAGRVLMRELGKFGVVGAVAFVVDVSLFNLLSFAGGEGPLHDRPLTAKVLSASVATVVAWLGNRHWTFRSRRGTRVGREFVLFAAVGLIGMSVSVGCLAFSHYVLGLTSPLADNISANVVGLVLGTAFRFCAYRAVVFTATHGQGAGPSSRRARMSEPVA